MSAPSARFPSTAWSCVQAAGDPQHPRHVGAFNRLITAYGRPVFHFLRAKYPAASDPEGLTQHFFLELVTKDWLTRADSTRGRFRDFLRTILERFAYDQTARAPRQTQFEQCFVSIHGLMQEDRAYESPVGETPEEAFDKEWKAALLQTVRRNLEAHYAAAPADERRRYEIFAALNFARHGEARLTQEDVAARFGISRDQVRYAAELVRKRSERLLRQEIRDQVGADVDVEEEIRKLRS